MSDFYAVLRDALARIGPGDVDQRTRVYGQVRTLMTRRLANRQPPLSPDELARRTEELDAAIHRIEAEMMLDDEFVTETPPSDPPPEAEDLWGGAREAPMPPATPSLPAVEGEAPEAIWGTPAIDLAWDQTTEQWLDPSEITARTTRPPTPRVDAPINGRATAPGVPPRPAASRPTASANRPAGEDRSPPARDMRGPASAPRIEPRIGVRAPAATAPVSPPERRDSSVRQRGEVRWPQIEPAAPPPASSRATPRAEAPRRTPDPSALDAAFAAAEKVPPVDSGGRTEPRLAASAGRRSEAPPLLFIEDGRGRAPVAEARMEPRRAPAPRATPRAPAAEAFVPPPPAVEDPVPGDFDIEETPEHAPHAARPRRSIGRKFAIALGVVAVLVLAWCLYVFIPILFPGGAEDPAAPAATGEARVPAEAGAAIVIFGGDERAVFVGLPDNPVGYETADTGAFARIASSTAGGARATIGRSVAQQLGGHTIRISLDARGTPGRESITARLGYQRGDALLEWQTINLGANFYVWTVDWNIPGGASTGDFLIIEPGIPGDGTALDIRRLTIQILE